MYQIDGDVGGRCGSLASSGWREAVLSPFTTQLLLPTSLSPLFAARARRIVLRTVANIASSVSLNLRASGSGLPASRSALSWRSSGEVSGNNVATLSRGKSLSNARNRSASIVNDRFSANSFPSASESIGVHGRGSYDNI